ncbi:hypothetical protein ACHQM5_023177 [Ranunculus cassubicifolius]
MILHISMNIIPSYYARQLFDEIPQRNALKLLHTFAPKFNQQGHFYKALASFQLNNKQGIKPTKFTLCSVLSSCTESLDWHLGCQIHAQIIQAGYEGNMFLNTKLVDLYAKCGVLDDAKRVFDGMNRHDHVSWTSIVAGFAKNGYGREALCLFKQMLGSGFGPNGFTFASVISGCVDFRVALEQGASLHAFVIKVGCERNNYVVSGLIDCYAKCGEINHAIFLYNESLDRDVILFNSMIAAYSQNLRCEAALKLFVEMQKNEITPTSYTISSILNACASMTVLQPGKQVHSFINKLGLERSVFITSSLIDMYSKCGSIDEARRVFDNSTEWNSVLWTSMITGYAHAGRGEDGLELFEHLVKEEGMRPDNICITAVLSACNHAGFADKATEYFNKMEMDYGLTPEVDQYACMVDLYGKTGQLVKAKKLLEQMPFEPNIVMLSSFLASCRMYCNVDLGREAANHLFKMDPYSAAPYVTLANIYAEAGMREEALQVRKMMREKAARKITGWSWIEVDQTVHVFSATDTSHSQLQYIYAELDKLNMEMMEAGYMPTMNFASENNSNECLTTK